MKTLDIAEATLVIFYVITHTILGHLFSTVSGFRTSFVIVCTVKLMLKILNRYFDYWILGLCKIQKFQFVSEIPYRTKIRRTKVSKFQLGVENFVRRNILSVENFVQYFNTKVRQKSNKTVEI